MGMHKSAFVSEQEAKARRARTARRVMLAVMCSVIAALVAWLALTAAGPYLREQGEESIRDAIYNSANQAYAIEGVYPKSLSYLEENYGLVVNRDDYVIVYEVFADNVMPNVMVKAR